MQKEWDGFKSLKSLMLTVTSDSKQKYNIVERFTLPLLKQLHHLESFHYRTGCGKNFWSTTRENETLDLTSLWEAIQFSSLSLSTINIRAANVLMQHVFCSKPSHLPNLKSLSIDGTILWDADIPRFINSLRSSSQKDGLNVSVSSIRVGLGAELKNVLADLNDLPRGLTFTLSIDVAGVDADSLTESMCSFLALASHREGDLEIDIRNASLKRWKNVKLIETQALSTKHVYALYICAEENRTVFNIRQGKKIARTDPRLFDLGYLVDDAGLEDEDVRSDD